MILQSPTQRNLRGDTPAVMQHFTKYSCGIFCSNPLLPLLLLVSGKS